MRPRSSRRAIFYLWRPVLPDPHDDHVLELAVEARAEKLAAVLTEEYLRERAGRASREKFEAALSRVPDAEPEERDRLD